MTFMAVCRLLMQLSCSFAASCMAAIQFSGTDAVMMHIECVYTM